MRKSERTFHVTLALDPNLIVARSALITFYRNVNQT
jgi:hypothetical protein